LSVVARHASENPVSDGLTLRGKRFRYDAGMRASLIIRVSERFTHLAPQSTDTVCDEQISLIDMDATVVSCCRGCWDASRPRTRCLQVR